MGAMPTAPSPPARPMNGRTARGSRWWCATTSSTSPSAPAWAPTAPCAGTPQDHAQLRLARLRQPRRHVALLDMFDELEAAGGAPLNSALLEYARDRRALKARGDEFIGHGRTNAETRRRHVGGRRAARSSRRCATSSRKHVGQAADRLDGAVDRVEAIVTPDLLKEVGYTYRHGLAGRRPADLDEDALRADPVRALSDRDQRQPGTIVCRHHSGAASSPT